MPRKRHSRQAALNGQPATMLTVSLLLLNFEAIQPYEPNYRYQVRPFNLFIISYNPGAA